MINSRTITAFVACLTALAALLVVIDRGGLIGWAALVFSIALLAKLWLKPSGLDLGLGLALAVIPAAAWIATFYYVINTWETGEVVELVIDTGNGPHTARLWVLDIGADPTVYYDADPQAAASLLAGKPLQFTRAGEVSTRIPQATRVDELPEDTANQVLDAMQTKYGDRNDAATVYYLMLGRSADRVALVADLIEQ